MIKFKKYIEDFSLTKNKKIYFYLFVLLSIIIMIIIFYFSHQTATKSLVISDSIGNKVYSTLKPSSEKMSAYEKLLTKIFVRKFAHFAFFGALGFCLIGALVNTKINKFSNKLLLAGIIGLFYSIFDEVHQIFIDGRTAEVVDVLLDFLGVIVGIIFLLMLYKISISFNKKRLKQKNIN